MANTKELKAMADEILALAKNNGVESNYLFVTTFDRYQTQIKVVERLKDEIERKDTEPTVKKEYVKNRGNVYVNPLYPEYNRAVDSANKTVSTLIKIIKNFGNGKTAGESDPLLEQLNGGGISA